MERLVYCIVLSVGFHSKHTKSLLPPYYDVPQVRTKFVLKWSGRCVALFYPLDFTQNTPNGSSHQIMMFPKFWTQSDIDWSLKLHNSGSYEVRTKFVLKWGGWCIAQFYPLDFTQNTPNDSSHHITMFPKFGTQTDIYWSVKLTTQVRTKFVLKWSGWCIAQFYPLDFTQNEPNDYTHQIILFPKFWTQSDIDWSVKLHNSGSYEVHSEMEWLVYCVVLSIGFHSKHTK
ncbi:unnamed protein product [Prunus armeniaca]